MIEKVDIHVKGKLTYKIIGKLNHVYRIDILDELCIAHVIHVIHCTCYIWIKSHIDNDFYAEDGINLTT